MNRALKIFLWVVGVILAIPVGLFLIGFLGLYEPAPSELEPVPEPVADVEVLETPAVSETAPMLPEHANISEPAHQTPLLLPENLDAEAASRWMIESGLITSNDGIIFVDFPTFKRLSMDDALTLHRLFVKAKIAEDHKSKNGNVSDLERRYYMMHLLVFAGASALPEDDRREFIKKSGAIFPTSMFHDGTHRGDYINLFEWHKTDKSGSAETAIRDYAKVLRDKDIIAALTQINVINVSQTRSNPNASSRWNIRAGELLAQLEPDTLQAIHDSIKKTVGGDRKKLRRALRQLIESRHTADNPPRD